MAVALAALRESNEIWDASAFTLTVGVLLISVLLAVHRTERTRAFWVGFAVTGAVYLALSAIPSIESRLITTKALAYVDSKVHRPVPNGLGLAYADFDADGTLDIFAANGSQPNRLYAATGNGTFQDVTASVGVTSLGDHVLLNGRWGRWLNGDSEHFLRIGHSVLALITAWVGGQVSRHLYIKNRQAADGQ